MNFFDILYILFSIGTGISLIIVLYSHMTISEDELKDDYIPYKSKYTLEVCEDDKHNDPKIQNFISENTPEHGTIIMRYNKEEEGFEYWCDKVSVDFKVLKTVCRKYCLTFNCKNLYIDTIKEAKIQRNAYIEKKKEEKKKKEKKVVEESIFVKPKIHGARQNKKFSIDWKDNKFIKRGKINESPLVQKKKKEDVKDFSFDDFKKMMKTA